MKIEGTLISAPGGGRYVQVRVLDDGTYIVYSLWKRKHRNGQAAKNLPQESRKFDDLDAAKACAIHLAAR